MGEGNGAGSESADCRCVYCGNDVSDERVDRCACCVCTESADSPNTSHRLLHPSRPHKQSVQRPAARHRVRGNTRLIVSSTGKKGVVPRENVGLRSSEGSIPPDPPEEKHLEGLKEESSMEERKTSGNMTRDESPPTLRECGCEYSLKNTHSDRRKCLYDTNEIREMRNKIEEALEEIKMCREEVEQTKHGKSMDFSAKILNDCQRRCVHLERLVQRLDRNLGEFEYNAEKKGNGNESDRRNSRRDTKEDPRNDLRSAESALEGDKPRRQTAQSKGRLSVLEPDAGSTHPKRAERDERKSDKEKRKQEQRSVRRTSSSPDHASGRKKGVDTSPGWNSRKKAGMGTTPCRVCRADDKSPGRVSRKQDSTRTYDVIATDPCCRHNGGACYHIKCFPSDYVINNPRFTDCRNYRQVADNARHPRRFKPS